MDRRTFLAGVAAVAAGVASTSVQAGSVQSGPEQSGSVQTAGERPLVAYFSCTGNTRAVAEQIAGLTGGDLFEIVPAQPYSSADLNYNDKSSRCYVEMHDQASRPAIARTVPNFAEYKTFYIGYPNWWNTFPRIINTFLEAHDFSGKIIRPFCTSGGSGVEKSVADIKKLVPTAIVRDGLLVPGVSARSSGERIASWVRKN